MWLSMAVDSLSKMMVEDSWGLLDTRSCKDQMCGGAGGARYKTLRGWEAGSTQDTTAPWSCPTVTCLRVHSCGEKLLQTEFRLVPACGRRLGGASVCWEDWSHEDPVITDTNPSGNQGAGGLWGGGGMATRWLRTAGVHSSGGVSVSGALSR